MPSPAHPRPAWLGTYPLLNELSIKEMQAIIAIPKDSWDALIRWTDIQRALSAQEIDNYPDANNRSECVGRRKAYARVAQLRAELKSALDNRIAVE